jgi:hypothetical protein
MSSNPDQLERDLDKTRTSLSGNVDRLNDKISPSKVLGRRMDRMKNSAGTIKEKVMGYADNSDGSNTTALSSAASSVQGATGAAAAKMSDAAGSAPQAVRDQTQGNPLAAGVIAFGVGWLLSALVPVSDVEQHAAKKIEDNADGLVEPLKESAQEVAGNLKHPLRESADSLRHAATDAAAETADQARSAAGEVRAQNPLTD